jgi:hypothetical protein
MEKQNSTKIIVDGRKHAVRVYEVGQRFAHAATVTIGGVKYESRDVPFGMRGQAVENLLANVQRKHPSAIVA